MNVVIFNYFHIPINDEFRFVLEEGTEEVIFEVRTNYV